MVRIIPVAAYVLLNLERFGGCLFGVDTKTGIVEWIWSQEHGLARKEKINLK